MSRVIIIEFVSVDAIMQDPDGTEGTAQGGWAFRYGPQAVAGDKFALGEILDTATMLLGRRTWQLFAGIWPGRDDEFSAKMNAMPKLVASRSLDQVAAWQNSAVLEGDLLAAVREAKQAHDIVVAGSASIVRALAAADVVDEYRLLVFPLVLGTGEHLFPSGGQPVDLALASAETSGPAVRLVYRRPASSHGRAEVRLAVLLPLPQVSCGKGCA
jgi:dihydrofolate reductase